MFTELKGTSYQNGKRIGKLSRDFLISRIIQVRRIQKQKKNPEYIFNARTKDWLKLVSCTAPLWLDEIKGMADGAGVCADEIACLNCLPPDFYPAVTEEGNNCTSFISITPEKSCLLKIRDERNFPQSFFITSNRKYPCMQAGRDIGNAGFAHFFNGKGLAGANNTGSPSENCTDKPLLNDCHVLRLIAETAEDINSIPEILQRLLEKGVMGGASSTRGAIYLFAHSEGGLLAECDTKNLTVDFIAKGNLTVSNHFLTAHSQKWRSIFPNKSSLLRKKRMEYLLSKTDTPPSPSQVFAITRDRKHWPYCLCNDNHKHFWMTVSAQYQVIDRKNLFDSINYVCCGNPRHSFYIPVPLTFVQNFIPMLNGNFYNQTDANYRKSCCRGKLWPEIKNFERDALANSKNTIPLFRKAHKLLNKLQT